MHNIAKFNMVEQQIKPWNVHSTTLLDAINRLDRSLFVPADQQTLCYADIAISLGQHLAMLEPKIVAHMIQVLTLQDDDCVLVVGAGSGYTAALCSMLAYKVDVVDTKRKALDRAAKACAAAGSNNITFTRTKDIIDTEYDAILAREPRKQAPEEILSQLGTGGRGVALINKGYIQEMICYTRQKTGKVLSITGESLLDRMVPGCDMTTPTQAFVF